MKQRITISIISIRLPETTRWYLLQEQLEESMKLCSAISEEKSLFRYAPDKWSVRQLFNHVTDTKGPLPSGRSGLPRIRIGVARVRSGYCSGHSVSRQDFMGWARRRVLLCPAFLRFALFKNMPADGWLRTGVASNNRFTVRAVAYVIAGHVAHHLTILRQRYLA
jgi:hypothetical protein